MDDPFVKGYDAADVEIAAEFLTNWLPFLTRDLCDDCSTTLRNRIRSLRSPQPGPAESTGDPEASDAAETEDPPDPSPSGPAESPLWNEHIEPSGWDTDPPSNSPKVRMSWADMAQEDELEEEEEEARKKSLVNEEGEETKEEKKKTELSRDQRELIRFKSVGRKKDFICLERINGKIVNILDGLELHTGVFSVVEQKRIVDFVYELQEKGRNLQLGEHTYSEPSKWMRGKGRVTIQFGCCYNYAMDKNGNPPGILRNVVADPIPHLFKVIIRRLIRWHVLPTSCVPDSCIVNIYEPGDCIPPHIDNHDFLRPFCTVSFLSECSILFGSNLKIVGPGEFAGSAAIPLPVGSVLVLNGNGADVAKHCVPAVPSKRISITFRKMDDAKLPFVFDPEPDLQNIQPLPYDSGATESQLRNRNKQPAVAEGKNMKKGKKSRGKPHRVGAKLESDFQESQHHLRDLETPTIRVPRQIIDARSAPGSGSLEKGRQFSGRLDPKPFQDDAEEATAMRWPQQEWSGEEGSSFEGGKELGGRRVRLDQRRIIISRNMEEEEQKPMWSHISDNRFPQVRIRPPNTGRRRVRVNLSDG